MLQPAAYATTARTASPDQQHAIPQVGAFPAESNAVVYICPMPEHLTIKYDRPGKCSICSMTLVPVSPETLARLQPGGRVEHYTCPMPEHNAATVAKSGKCPKCATTLIPVMEPPPPP